MKLISCHIENFGKLSNLDIDFRDTYNEYIEENGWGKSTLVAFIQAMFYGLSSKGKDLGKNERQRYMPWQGGLFGGRLCFESQGKRYVLTRYFEKKEKDDVFKLRDERTNLISKDYSVAIGEELFGINKDAFCRTILISQKDCQTVANDSIMSKIGNLTENTDDVNNYESAMSGLTKYLNNQSPTRKTGELYKIVQRIEELKQFVRGEQILCEKAEALNNQKSELLEEQNKLKDVRAKIQDKIDVASKRKDLLIKKEKHDLLKQEVQQYFEKIDEYKKQFPAGVPDKETIEHHIKESTKAFLLQEKLNECQLSDEEEVQYQELKELFSDLTDEEMGLSLSAELRRLIALGAVIKEKELSTEENYRYRELIQIFGDKLPDLEEIEACIFLWNEICNKKICVATHKNKNHPKKTHSLSVIITGVLVVLGGLFVKFNVSKTVGMIISILGFLAVVVGFLLKSKNKNNHTENDAENEDITIAEQENMLMEYLAKYSIPYDEHIVSSSLHQTFYNAKELLRLAEKQKKYLNCKEVSDKYHIEERILSIAKKVLSIKTIESNSIEMVVNQYETQKQKYQELSEKKHCYEDIKRQHDVIVLHTEMYLNTIGLKAEENISSQLQQIKETIMLIEIATDSYFKKSKELKKYEAEEDIIALNDVKEDENSVTDMTEELKTISNRLESIHNEIGTLNKQIEEVMEKKDEIEEQKNELHHLEQLKKESDKKYYLAEQTRQCLEKAKQTMTSTFTKPMLDEFCRLYAIITNDDKKAFYMDAETKITVDEKGMQRDTEYFSAGYRDLYGLCLRLAFIKAMFKGEKPFIVLDDTFVNLDEEKTKKAIQLLEKISDEYQVLYFTCHKSRSKN